MISISQINKLGKSIKYSLRETNQVEEDDLIKLQEYRVSFQNTLNEVFDYLVIRSKFHFKGSLTVYRLKRIDTIIRKISRYPNMALANMQDIAGCRSIVWSEKQIYNIVKDFENNPEFEIIDRDDYIKKPRDTGYSSYHLIVRPINSERCTEIQLRTRNQHDWATLVEITDLIFNIKLKEGDDHPDLYLFHKLLAKGKKSLSLTEMIELVSIEKKYNIITKVTSLFKSNYYVSIDRWGKALNNHEHHYLLMELDNNLSPLFYFYDDFTLAEIAYFQKFNINEPNMVLIYMNKPNFKNIGLAYSNYVLTSHPSIRFYLKILQNLILQSYENKNFNDTKMYHQYYKNMVDQIIYSFHKEIESMNGIINDYKKSNNNNEDAKKRYLNLILEWQQNMRERLNYIEKSSNDFFKQFNNLGNEEINPFRAIKNFLKSIFKS